MRRSSSTLGVLQTDARTKDCTEIMPYTLDMPHWDGRDSMDKSRQGHALAS
jgi:hypothetical protein